MGVVRRSDEEAGLAQRRNIYFGTSVGTQQLGTLEPGMVTFLEPSSGVSLTISKNSVFDQVFILFTSDLVNGPQHLFSLMFWHELDIVNVRLLIHPSFHPENQLIKRL